MKYSLRVPIAAVGTLLLIVTTSSRSAYAQNRARIVVPTSSIERPEDLGVRAHTNIIINIPPAITTSPAATWETPASIACVYELVTQVSGCPISGTAALPTGGQGAIAIVDAYDDPTAQNDLAVFIAQFNLAPATFEVVYAAGTKPPQDSTGGWELEESLDIEWAHAMAPNAKLYLVEAASNSNSDLFSAVQVASNLVSAAGGGVVSMSWGQAEFSLENLYDSYFTTSGVTYFASTGDRALTLEYPSVSPNVIAAGGTAIQRNASGDFTGEIYWDGCNGEGGGGLSAFEGIPSYQGAIRSIVGSHRGVPDISSDASPCSGLAVYDTTAYNGTVYGWLQVGGTSAAAPVLAARADAASLSPNSIDVLTNIYGAYGAGNAYGSNHFRDITQGR